MARAEKAAKMRAARHRALTGPELPQVFRQAATKEIE